MKRFFNWLKALFNRGMDQLEDPDIMLDQARRDMQQTLISNREKAVQAITQRNRLSSMLEETKRKSTILENQAAMALKQGNRDLALQLIREKTSNDSTLTTLQSSFDQASTTVEQVKVAVKRQEEEVRKKTAEALAMKAQWKQAQIQNSISKALDGLTFENQFESFGAAAEKIRDAQSEAQARQEMVGSSIAGKVLDMQDKSMDYEAESELEKLEQKLGMKPATTTTTDDLSQQVTVGANGAPGDPNAAAPQAPLTPEQSAQADKELDELEKRLNNP